MQSAFIKLLLCAEQFICMLPSDACGKVESNSNAFCCTDYTQYGGREGLAGCGGALGRTPTVLALN